MKKTLIFMAATMLFGADIAFAQVKQKNEPTNPLDVKELKLKNGLTVWLNEDHSQPKVWGAVVVKAGGVTTPNEGIAHYFEHIMFKGTDQIGTLDYAKEKPLLDSISDCYDKLAQTTDETERMAIQKKINRLNIAAAEYAIPNEYTRLIELYGGSGLNAGTANDFTMYYNIFSPQYMRQWLELNSHRLLNPVFRLFQGELEAVYEEKNMYADQPMAAAVEDAQAKWFGTNPYAYPIIGSTENLKNPQMSKMREFYKKYYVAGNMALILTGDFKAEDVEPWLEGTFGRLPAGTPTVSADAFVTPKHNGETYEIKIPIPIVNIFALLFDYPKNGHADDMAMEVAMGLLSNDSQTGLLDQLMTDKKALGTTAAPLQQNNGGVLLMLAMPKLFHSSKKLEKMVWEKFDMLKAGDFSDEVFSAVKNGLIDSHLRDLETIGDRGGEMMDAWISGKTWEEKLASIDQLRNITREDVMAAANRYITRDNFMRLKKKFGTPKRDKLSQPGYEPVSPKRGVGESAYAKMLRDSIPVQPFSPRLIDLKNDAKKTSLGNFANLYTVENPIDSLFTFSVYFYRGTKADPMIDPLISLYSEIGTQEKTRKEFNEALLHARATLDISSNGNGVAFTLNGHDSKFHEAMTLLAEMINSPKADKESFKNVVDGLSVSEKSFDTENTTVLVALWDKLAYGDRSRYINRATKKEVKAMKPEELLAKFDDVKKAQMAVIYSGKLAEADVEKTVREMLPVNLPTEPAADVFRPLSQEALSFAEKKEDNPIIYFYNMKKARQALVGTYAIMPAEPTAKERETAQMWEDYYGGSMTSVMFQELREFRSLGYTCGETTGYPSLTRHPNEKAPQLMYVGTQADKVMTAIAALDSIMTDMPLSEATFESIKSSRLNSISHNFPNFRNIGGTIATLEAYGETRDPDHRIVENLPALTLQDIADFHNNKVKTAHRAYIVIGDKKAVDMQALHSLGTVVEVKTEEIFNRRNLDRE